MHIADGLLEPEVVAAGFALSAALAVYSLKNSQDRENFSALVPRISMVTAALFISSLLNIPVGPTTVHFSFVGLAGILLGPLSVLAVIVSLIMQLLLFNHGGFSTLGMNAANFALAALTAHYLFQLRRSQLFRQSWHKYLAFLAVAAATLVKIAGASLALYYSGFPAGVGLSLTAVHLPIILAEGLLTAAVVIILMKGKRVFIYEEIQDLV